MVEISVPDIDIAHECDDWREFTDIESLITNAVTHAVDQAGLKFPAGAELSIVLGDDELIRGLNRQWRNQDKPTNVLSFPGSDIIIGETAGQMLGDIVFAFETVAREASEQGKTFRNHLTHLVIHGFLHLFGYDHVNDNDADVMEKLETETLARLGISDPYEQQHNTLTG